MKKSGLVVMIFLLATAIFAFAVNVPRQPLLFFNITNSLKNATSISPEVAELLNLAVAEDLDPETNVPSIASRFDYNFYPNSNIYAVEMSVMAAKYLGIEHQVLQAYPLAAPTFSDIQSELAKAYQNKGYDFSRDFGYFDYVNSYVKKIIGYPLFDKNIQPLTELTRAQVIKALVRIFAAKNDDKALVTEAEALSKRFSANPQSGILVPKDAGYVSVFEKYFFTEKNGELNPLIKLSYFTKDNLLNPEKKAKRWWAIALTTMMYFEGAHQLSANTLVPVRTLNNFITYISYKDLNYNVFTCKLPILKTGTINKMNVVTGPYSVFAMNLDNGVTIAGLDNTKVTLKITTENGKTSSTTSKTYERGSDFVSYYDNLPQNATTITEISTKIINGILRVIDGKIYVFYDHKKIELPSAVTVEICNINNVGTIKDLETLLNALSHKWGIPSNFNFECREEKTVKPKDLSIFNGMRVQIKIVIIKYITTSKMSKKDFIGAKVKYQVVIDRLNMTRKIATLGSVKTFNKIYENSKSLDNCPTDFIGYWRNVEENLESLNVSTNTKLISEAYVSLNRKVTSPKSTEDIVPPKVPKIKIVEVYVGKLVSFEPATHRIFSQLFVDPFSYKPSAPVKFEENGKTTIYPNMVVAQKAFFTQKGGAKVLKNVVMWFQFELVGQKPVVSYITAKVIK